MAEQEQARRRERPDRQEVEDDQEAGVVDTEAETEQIDDLLDEIDAVLEENAEEFVKNYVQKGGE